MPRYIKSISLPFRQNNCSSHITEVEHPVTHYPHDDNDLDILAKTIYGEARGETDKGRMAVAWTVRNRAAKSPKYGWSDNIRLVCLQAWQFSCWNDNDPNSSKLRRLSRKDPLYLECLDIAKKVLEGKLQDPTKGADHYYADYISPPDWARGQTPTAVIGTHLFFELV